MSLPTALARWRRRQAELFSSQCSITRSTGQGAFDENTGTYAGSAPTAIYSGACLIRPAGTMGSDVVAGDQEFRIKRLVLKLPVDTAVKEDDVVTVTASDHDAGLVGRTFRITDVVNDDWQVARVAILEESA